MDKPQITFLGNPVTLVGDQLHVGDKAPSFSVLDNNLQPVSLSQYAGKNIIISVFPSVDTPVCALSCFCGADHTATVHVSSAYRALDFGLKYGFVIKELRLLARGVVVIDREGTIRHIEYVSEVSHEPDYEAALKVVSALE